MLEFHAFLKTFVLNTRENERGQTMAEYAIVLSVITIAIIVTLGFLAGGISQTLESVTAGL